MRIRSISGGRLLALILGVFTLADAALLLVLNAIPRLFPPASHHVLAAFALAMIAMAYLIFQWTKRPAPLEFAKAILLAAAFLFWAANQFWPDWPQAGLFNDIAIGLFVLDVFLVMLNWPQAPAETSFAECDYGGTVARFSGRCCGRGNCSERCC